MAAQKKLEPGSKYASFDKDGDGTITDEEFEMIEISAIRYIEVGKAARLGESAGPFSHFSIKPIPNEN